MFKSKEFKFWLVFLLISAWIYSGWPRIWDNLPLPPKIRIVQATAPTQTVFITSTASTTWDVPTDWNNASNTIEVIGGGGGGDTVGNNTGNGGGGGGAYAKKSNVSLTPGSSIGIKVGAGGGQSASGTATYFNGSGTTCSGQSVCANGGWAGGRIGTATSSGPGGASSTSIGDIKYDGGAGGYGHTTGDLGGGGGGAGGPLGNGWKGGDNPSGSTSNGGGGGGGGGGGSGSAGVNGGSTGGAGGNGYAGAGGGAGGNGTNGGNATSTAGGGGAGDNGFSGGNGSSSCYWTSSLGVCAGPGGGGGGGTNAANGGNGAVYGGGGGGGESNAGTGGQGIIVIRYDPIITMVLGDGSVPSNATIGPGGAATKVDEFTLWATTSTTFTVTNVTTTLAAGTTSSIAKVEIRDSPGVTTYGSTTNPTANSFSINVSGSGMTATNSTTTFTIYITPKSATAMPASPGSTYSVTATVTSYSGTGADTLTGSDPTSATITIDNQSPGDVASASGTAGDSQVTLTWTNPSDSDYATTTVLRATSTIADFALTEGTAYATGTQINATTTVACVVGGGAGAGVGCTDTGLTNGTAYYYKIFAADNYANYATGTVPSGSPFTPFSATVSCSTDVSSVSFGTLSVSSVSTASPNASTTVSCTYANGCTLNIQDAGNGSNPGLATTSPAYLIPSNTATLSAGTEGYGVQATTTATGSGATLSLNQTYNKSGNDVGGFSLSATILASSTASFTNREAVVTHKAAINNLTNTANYKDTITYSCVGNL